MASSRLLTTAAVLLGAGVGTSLALLERPPVPEPVEPAQPPKVDRTALGAAPRQAPPEPAALEPAAHSPAAPPPQSSVKQPRIEPVPYDVSPPKDAASLASAERACGVADDASECLRAAAAYATGTLVARDERKIGILNHRARTLFESACQRNEAQGCYALAWLYANGRTVPQSSEGAETFFTRALALCRVSAQSFCQRLGEKPK